MAGRYITLDPTSPAVVGNSTVAQRPKTLDGLTVGLLINGFGRSDLLLDAVYEELKSRYELAGVVRAKKGGVTIPIEKPNLDLLVSQANVVVAAFGG